jgi:dephospho-CoA kinase
MSNCVKLLETLLCVYHKMEMNQLLSRQVEEQNMISFLQLYNKQDETQKRGVYIHGPPGCGKTTFATSILKKLDYDIITYMASDSRNKNIVESINVSNMSDTNIMSIFCKKKKKLVILMDEIECMNNGDKGGINSLIKLIRPKKTKKQKLEQMTHVPIICIGNTTYDKKMKELMKCCFVIELKLPTLVQMNRLMIVASPSYAHLSSEIKDLKKVFQLVKAEKINFKGDIQSMLYSPVHEDSRQITKRLLNTPVSFHEHVYINDTERTIISMLWHENVIDIIQKMKKKIPLYYTLLNEICFADYLDRIMFQKQLWGFNEMSFLLKTFYMNYLFHQEMPASKVSDIRFTKILTKYSTEYNNSGFIQKMCTELCMDKKDLFFYMQSLKPANTDLQIAQLFENTEITLLDIQRIYRYINKCLD